MNSSQLITCRTPALPGLPEDPWVRVEFILDNLVFDFATLNPTPFSYEPDPTLQPLNEVVGEKGPDDEELDRSFDEILKIFNNKDRF